MCQWTSKSVPRMLQTGGDAVAAILGGSDGNHGDEGVAVSESDARDAADGA